MSAAPTVPRARGETFMDGWPVLAIFALTTAMAAAALLGSTPNAGFKDAAAVIALVSAAAIAIERTLELVWTFANETVGQWWPFSRIVRQLNVMAEEIDTSVGPFFDQARDAVQSAQGVSQQIKDRLNADLTAQQNAVTDRLSELRQLAPTNQRIELLTTVAFQAISRAQKVAEQHAPAVQGYAGAAHQAVAGTVDFLATLKENPGRRMMSIYGGMVLGLAVAGLTGLDLFGAMLGADAAAPTGTRLGVVLTGLLIGLGSGPTHSVLAVLQEIRKARRLETLAIPETEASVSGAASGTANVFVLPSDGAVATRPFAAGGRSPFRMVAFDTAAMGPELLQERPLGPEATATAGRAGDVVVMNEPARVPGRIHTLMLRRR